jgi:hypothetical protein
LETVTYDFVTHTNTTLPSDFRQVPLAVLAYRTPFPPAWLGNAEESIRIVLVAP